MGASPLAVKGVLLQQGEERFRRRVVTGSTDLAHRADEVMLAQGVDGWLGAELGSAVGVDDAPGHAPRWVTALFSVSMVRRAFIRESIE